MINKLTIIHLTNVVLLSSLTTNKTTSLSALGQQLIVKDP